MNKVINITSNGIKQAIDDLVNENKMLQDKVYKLENIINELEKELFIKKEFYERELTKRPTNDSEYNTRYADNCALAQISVIYNKLQELKGSNKE